METVKVPMLPAAAEHSGDPGETDCRQTVHATKAQQNQTPQARTFNSQLLTRGACVPSNSRAHGQGLRCG